MARPLKTKEELKQQTLSELEEEQRKIEEKRKKEEERKKKEEEERKKRETVAKNIAAGADKNPLEKGAEQNLQKAAQQQKEAEARRKQEAVAKNIAANANKNPLERAAEQNVLKTEEKIKEDKERQKLSEVAKNLVSEADRNPLEKAAEENIANLPVPEKEKPEIRPHQQNIPREDPAFRYMTAEEKQKYELYKAITGEESAQNYLDSIREQINRRQAEKIYSGNENEILSQYLLGAQAGLESSKTGFQDAIKMFLEEGQARPTSTSEYLSEMARNDLAEKGPKLPEALGGASLGQIGFDVVNTTANMLPSIMLGTLGGGAIGAAGIGASAAGNAYNSALREGYTQEQARNYGLLVGAAEASLGYLLGGIEATGGKIGKGAMAKLLPKIDNALARAAVNVGGKMGSEFSEEYLQEILDPMFRNLALLEENEINLLSPEAIYSGILGALSAGGIAIAGGNASAPEVLQKAEVPVPFEGTAQPGTERELVANKIAEIENRPISEAEKAAKMEEVAKAAAENGTEPGLAEEAERIGTFHKERQAEFDEAVLIGNKLGVSVEFDSNIAGNGIHTGNGRIIINPNTENPALQVFVHELTHDIETSGIYQNFSEKILGHIKEQGFDLEGIRQRVKTEYAAEGHNLTDPQIDAEVVAKYCEQHLFTDEKAIQRLLDTDPNLFSRIKYWIEDMIVKFKGTKEERFLLEAQGLYEKALSTRGKTTGAGISEESVGRGFDELANETDSEGNELSPGQREYFKDSKIRDENGNLLVMYHGTPNAGFTQFRSGTYFTQNKGYAEIYKNQGASSLSYKRTADNPDVYAVYLNIKKPFDTRNPKERRIFMQEFYGQWGNGSPLADSGLPDWVDGMDLQEFIEENGYDYDGLILDEGAVGGYGDEVVSRGLSYVVFSPEQVKNVDNRNPTENPDIRYSTGSSFDEMAGEAKAEHGVSESVSAEISDSAKRVIEQMRPRKPKVQSSTSQVNPEPENVAPVEVPQSEKSKRIERRYQKAVEDGVASVFGIDRADIKNDIRPILEKMAADIKDGNKITDEQIERLYKTAFENGYITEEFPQYDEIRKYIREHPIYVSQENRNEFGTDKEFYNFMRSNYGNIKVTTDPGAIHLDEFFDNLSSMEPDFFDGFETDPKTQLEDIADFMNRTEKRYFGLSEYYSGTDLANFEAWAKKELKAYMDEFGKGLDTVARYERDRQIKAEHKAKEMNPEASFEQAKAAFAGNKVFNLQKELEKVKAKYALSKNDIWAVKRLLEGTLKEEDVRASEGSNVKGILEVYNAEKAYKEARAPFDRYSIAFKQSINHDAINALERSDEFKDKKGKIGGALLSVETAERNVRDIAGDEADKIIENYFNNVHEHEAMSNRFMAEMNQRVKDLEIGKMNRWERAYAQMIGENAKYIAMGKITKHNQAEHERLNSKIQDLLNKHGNKIDKAKCEKAAAGFMGIYQDIFEKINDERIRVGLEPIGYIENYFPHFVEAEPETVFQKFFSKVLGMDVGDSKLPTDIAGKTADRKPGKKWNPHTLERKGDVTDYDILKGFDGYLRLAAHNIYHTEDIKKLRALSETIRTKYASTDLEKRIEELMNNKTLSEADRSELIQKAISEVPDIYHLSNFVVWLDEYTNILAGKKSYGDRDTEYLLGREMYDVSKAIEGRIASNMIGYNLSTPFMNTIPLFQATADIPPQNIISSVVQTGIAALKKDSFISDNSDFITNRLGTDTLYKQNYNIFEAENMKDFVAKVSDGGSFLMGYVDRIVSESLVRARYEQNLKNGMDKVSAFSEADQWAAGLIADRSLGSMPTIMNRKNPIIKAFTMFQLEQANQYSYIFKDAGKYKWNKKGKMSTISGQIAFWIAMAVAGDLAKELLNKEDAVPNPVGITKDIVEKVQKGEKAGNIVLDTATTIIKQIPYVGGVLGGGRVPLATALPEWKQLAKVFDKEEDVSWAKKQDILVNELLRPMSYLLLPSGAGQIWKTGKGIQQIAEGGAFGTENDGSRFMKFPQENDPESLLKTIIFGQYASDRGQQYIDSGFKDKLSAKQTEQMEVAEPYGISNSEFYDIILGLKPYSKKEEKQEALFENENLDNWKKSVMDYILFGNPTKGMDAVIPEREYNSEEEFYRSGLSDSSKRLFDEGYNKNEIEKIEKALSKSNKKADDIANIVKALGVSEQEAFEIYQKSAGDWYSSFEKLPEEERKRAEAAADFYGMSTEDYLKVFNYSNFGKTVVDKDGKEKYSSSKKDVVPKIAEVLNITEKRAEELYDRVNSFDYSRDDLEEETAQELEIAAKRYGVEDRTYFIARNIAKTVEGDKDEYGNTISGSEKEKAVKAISSQLGISEEEATIYYLAATGNLILTKNDLTTSQRKDLEAAQKEGWSEREFFDAINIIKVSGASKKMEIIKALTDAGAPYSKAQGFYNLSKNYDYWKR